MKSMYLICNAHIDPVWQWDWEEGLAATLSTFRSVVNLSREYDFVFAHNEAILYRWTERYDPELFAEIKKLIAAGKWKIMGGWYLQPDCNLPAAESLIRQIQTGNAYFRETFGAECRTAVNFDTFGHSAALPQILKKCGYDSYMFCRPMADYSEIPENFVWRGADGSEVIAARVSGFYNNPMGYAGRKIESEIERFRDSETCVVLWGIGNHGGGPSRVDLEDVAKCVERHPEIEFVQGVPEDFVDSLKTQSLPVCEGGINPMFPGCYTSQVRLKQAHARLESALYLTEKFCVLASLEAGNAYDRDALERAQDDLLFSEFHDTLAGTVVKPALATSFGQICHGEYLLSEVRAKCMTALSAYRKPPAPGDVCIGIFNPFPYPAEVAAELDLMLPSSSDAGFVDLDVTLEGVPVPSQVVKEESNIPIEWAKKVAVTCTLPAFEVSCFYLHPVRDRPRSLPGGVLREIPCGKYRVRVGESSGVVEEITRDGVPVLGKSAYPVLYRDNFDPWGMQKYQHRRLAEVEGEFALADPALSGELSGTAGPLAPVRVVEEGRVLTKTESVLFRGLGYAILNYLFYRDRDFFDIRITLNNAYHDRMVKLQFPIPAGATLVGGLAAGEEKIGLDGVEHCFQRYVRCVGGGYAVSGRGIYGASAKDGKLEISLLRTPVYAGHFINEEKPVVKNDRYLPRVDRGENEFSLRVFLGTDEELAARVERLSREFLEPPVILSVSPGGKERAHMPVLLSGDPEIVLTACKLDRTGDPLFRFYNGAEGARRAVFRFGESELSVSFGKYELKTVVFREGMLSETAGLEI